jgi:hypothetical protein
MLEFLHNLELPLMFAATLVLAFIAMWMVYFAVRLSARWAGLGEPRNIPFHGNVLTSASALFALMLAFSAAGIWTDTLQARSAVQREANALENILGLANGLPPELRDTVKNSVVNYAQGVVEGDWPAMRQKVQLGDFTYGNSDRVLVHLIDYLSSEIAGGVAPPIVSGLLSQLFEVRSARVARLTLASGGLTVAQWLALLVLAVFVMVMIGTLHNHIPGFQIVVMHLYATATAAAFMVILAHNGAFVGANAVSPAPLVEIANRTVG